MTDKLEQLHSLQELAKRLQDAREKAIDPATIARLHELLREAQDRIREIESAR